MTLVLKHHPHLGEGERWFARDVFHSGPFLVRDCFAGTFGASSLHFRGRKVKRVAIVLLVLRCARPTHT